MKKLNTLVAIIAFLFVAIGVSAQSNTKVNAQWDDLRTENIVKFVDNNTSANRATITQIRAFVAERVKTLDMSVKTGPNSMRAFRKDVLAMLEDKLSAADYSAMMAKFSGQ